MSRQLKVSNNGDITKSEQPTFEWVEAEEVSHADQKVHDDAPQYSNSYSYDSIYQLLNLYRTPSKTERLFGALGEAALMLFLMFCLFVLWITFHFTGQAVGGATGAVIGDWLFIFVGFSAALYLTGGAA